MKTNLKFSLRLFRTVFVSFGFALMFSGSAIALSLKCEGSWDDAWSSQYFYIEFADDFSWARWSGTISYSKEVTTMPSEYSYWQNITANQREIVGERNTSNDYYNELDLFLTINRVDGKVEIVGNAIKCTPSYPNAPFGDEICTYREVMSFSGTCEQAELPQPKPKF